MPPSSPRTAAPLAFADLEPSLVADPALAAEGEWRVAWARAHMPVLGRLRAEMERDRPLAGRRIGMCLHVEAKTAVLVETLLAGGAEIAWTGSPATTDDGVAAAMTARANLRIYALKADDTAAHHAHIARVLASDPDMLLDNGADLIAGTVEDPASRVFAATEETTSGRLRLTGELAGRVPFPVIVINDSPIKLSFESERGIGPADGRRVLPRHQHVRRRQDVRRRRLRLVRPEPRPDAARAGRRRPRRGDRPGAGARGGLRGDARHDDREGRRAARTRSSPSPAGRASSAASTWRCSRTARCSATWATSPPRSTSRGLREIATGSEMVNTHVEEFDLPNGRRVNLLARGEMLNLTAATGHQIEVMDLGFALQAHSMRILATDAASLRARLPARPRAREPRDRRARPAHDVDRGPRPRRDRPGRPPRPV